MLLLRYSLLVCVRGQWTHFTAIDCLHEFVPALKGSPIRSGSHSAGSGGGRGISSGSGINGVPQPPPSPSRLNPLAQPWAAPFMTRDPNGAGLTIAGMSMGPAGDGNSGASITVMNAQNAGPRMNGGEKEAVVNTPSVVLTLHGIRFVLLAAEERGCDLTSLVRFGSP